MTRSAEETVPQLLERLLGNALGAANETILRAVRSRDPIAAIAWLADWLNACDGVDDDMLEEINGLLGDRTLEQHLAADAGLLRTEADDPRWDKAIDVLLNSRWLDPEAQAAFWRFYDGEIDADEYREVML